MRLDHSRVAQINGGSEHALSSRASTDWPGPRCTFARSPKPCAKKASISSFSIRTSTRLGAGQSELALAGGRDGREQEPDLATRLRDAAAGIDPSAVADRAAAMRDGREAEERTVAQEAAREQELVKELERQQEIERETHRDRGYGIDR
ncbi:hypothetical protein [Sulfitobacter marinivivus]|uniref:hypothetical protein n=1 Tax=Sulfitobacter marinivivus TaxID=3158558 RepID=UPI003F6F60B6